jgi:hypothetical protein
MRANIAADARSPGQTNVRAADETPEAGVGTSHDRALFVKWTGGFLISSGQPPVVE